MVQKTAVEFAGVPAGLIPLGNTGWSFDGILRRVLGLSRAAELDRNDAALHALRIFAQTLDVPVRHKLRALMNAGRDGRALGPTSAALLEHGPEVATQPKDLFDDGLESVDHLRRGHAIACATRFDLETEVGGWASVSPRDSLDDRVWLRFGREIAASAPDDWACLAKVGRGTELEELYLRRGEARWWSFDRVIDRPSLGDVARRAGAPARQRGRLVRLPIDAVIGRHCRSDRPALRRAAMAMSARLGACRGA